MKKSGLLIFFFLCLGMPSCTGQAPKSGRGGEKINGISFVASRNAVTQQQVDEVVRVNANHAAVMPFASIRKPDSPKVIFDENRQWFGETKKGVAQYIELLHNNGIKTMVKPQIWIWKGEFTGTLKMNSEADWIILENTYRDFIITFAKVAEQHRSELFCIGTELEQFVMARPNYWLKLISEIREVYSGKLTYAANWDEFSRVPFWHQLDYIGIDAYFPLSEEKTPSFEQLQKAWQAPKKKIRSLSQTCSKPVLFTEFGYRSTDQNAWKPWLVDRHEEPVNLEAQANATGAILREFWSEDWFVGGYIWKWFIDHDRSGGKNDNRFTPQNKPAERVLREFYATY